MSSHNTSSPGRNLPTLALEVLASARITRSQRFSVKIEWPTQCQNRTTKRWNKLLTRYNINFCTLLIFCCRFDSHNGVLVLPDHLIRYEPWGTSEFDNHADTNTTYESYKSKNQNWWDIFMRSVWDRRYLSFLRPCACRGCIRGRWWPDLSSLSSEFERLLLCLRNVGVVGESIGSISTYHRHSIGKHIDTVRDF